MTLTASDRQRDADWVPPLLRPFVDFFARIHARLEAKLLAAFLVIAVLMLALGTVGLFVVNRMDAQVERIAALQLQSDRANRMLYQVTAQSHFRTMALLTDDPVWTDKIVGAKQDFTVLLDEAQAATIDDRSALFADLRAIDERFADAGIRVESMSEAGDDDGALQAHIQSEHEISHELEDLLNGLLGDAENLAAVDISRFDGDRTFLTVALATVSLVSLLGALALGAIISWSVIRPVRKIDHALGSLADGDFTARIEVPNRDEFGVLTSNVNRASEQLESLYQRLERVNQDLQSQIEEQLSLLEHTSQLRRYLSPQVAESIVTGRGALGQSRRAELTIAFVDVRGFTALSEHSEPEEMVGSLNHFLTAMTDIVFRHEGTLDKYIGDAIMVFFNDPLPQHDHAERAVRMALEMQRQMVSLSAELSSAAMPEIAAGIGIATGYVTVGNFGSPNRVDYTVVGNHVNLASRLAGDAAPGEILITERTLALLPDGLVSAQEAGRRDLKGVRRPINLYRVSAD